MWAVVRAESVWPAYAPSRVARTFSGLQISAPTSGNPTQVGSIAVEFPPHAVGQAQKPASPCAVVSVAENYLIECGGGILSPLDSCGPRLSLRLTRVHPRDSHPARSPRSLAHLHQTLEWNLVFQGWLLPPTSRPADQTPPVPRSTR